MSSVWLEVYNVLLSVSCLLLVCPRSGDSSVEGGGKEFAIHSIS